MAKNPIDLELRRIRWNAAAALSRYRNLDILSGYDCAKLSLLAIMDALDRIDAIDQHSPSVGRVVNPKRIIDKEGGL